MQDVNIQSGKIFIAESKGNRDRIVMLCGDILDICHKYNEAMNELFPDRNFFFAKNTTDACDYKWFNHIFRGLLAPLQIESRYGSPPRLYDLRHTFATHRLYRWMKDGKDLHAMMPYLSAYMGHARVSDTYYYIHLVPGMHEEMSDFRYESPKDIFPKAVDSDE
jgi:integrase